LPKVTEYNEITSISGSSTYLYVVDISGGSPAYGKISGSNLGTAISGSSSSSTSIPDSLKIYLNQNFT